jgi:hypothetical protein
MILIDNGWGATMNLGIEGDTLSTILKNSIIYGETVVPDCDYQNECLLDLLTNAPCVNKHGIMIPNYTTGDKKEAFPMESDSLPMNSIMDDASWSGATSISNVTFSNFLTNISYCGTQ